MKSGTQFEQGDILIAPFPFTDLKATKQRPVLVLSKKEYNTRTEDVITCGITSNLKNETFSILIDNQNLKEGQMPVKSRIKVDKLFTINQGIIKKKIGKLNDQTFNKVKQELFKLI